MQKKDKQPVCCLANEKQFVARDFNKQTFAYSGFIAQHKNVFVTPEYFNALLRALKHLEMTRDLCNLAFVILPNHFQWIFEISEKERPHFIYGELKKLTAREILDNLKLEAKDKNYEFKPLDFFKKNKIKRLKPKQILAAFKQEAEKSENRIYRVWEKGGYLKPIRTQEDLIMELQKLKQEVVIGQAKWTCKPEDYPYLYVNEQLEKYAFIKNTNKIKGDC